MIAAATEAAPAVAERAAPWQPRLTALVCNWCTYAGADMAGTARRAYAPTVRIVRVLCTGRLDPLLALKAFQGGADGVIVSGCHPGDCHYVQGNLLARRRFTVFAALMDFLGLDRRRLHLAWVSASEGIKWARVVDEATEAVRELGPLGEWTAPSGPAPPLPDPGPEPRTPPPAEVSEAIAARLRELAARLLEEGAVSVVAGYGAGALPGQAVPLLVRRPQEARALVWNERCAANLLVYLPELRRRGEGRVAVVAKSCDAKALAGLVRERQVAREEVVLIGVPCQGVWPDDRLALKCYACAEEVSPAADVTVTPDGPVEGARPRESGRATGPDPRDAQIQALQALAPEERRAYWQRQLARCLRCYACRAVCPLCYCPTCIADRNRPRWIPVTFDGRGNAAWNVARAMHLAGRCVGCDECARACPADIRLDLLNRRLAVEIERRYGPSAASEPEQPAPLLTFRPDDPDEFL